MLFLYSKGIGKSFFPYSLSTMLFFAMGQKTKSSVFKTSLYGNIA